MLSETVDIGINIRAQVSGLSRGDSFNRRSMSWPFYLVKSLNITQSFVLKWTNTAFSQIQPLAIFYMCQNIVFASIHLSARADPSSHRVGGQVVR